MDVFLERKLDAESRNKMKDSTFGLPEERKYPLNDASHVKSAIAFFKYCPADKKHSLAKRIISAAKRFGVKISEDSRVWKIVHEAVMFEDEYDESNGIVLQEADKKKNKEEEDELDAQINDDNTEEIDTNPVDYTDMIDNDNDENIDDPIDYTDDEPTDDVEGDTDPIDYTQELDDTEETPTDDNPTTLADDDEPTDYTQDVDTSEDTPDDDAPQDYTQDINTDDSDPNIDNSNVKPEEPTLGGNTDNNDNSQAQLSPEEGGDDDTEPEDYTQDIDSGDGVGGTEGNPADDGSDLPPDDGTGAGMQPSGGTELQNMQNDVFSSLSPEQMKIKIANIKQSFIDLYNDVVEILERLSTVNKSSSNLESINFATITLNELKTMLNDHLVSTFETKSLVENQITLQRFLAIYAMVIKILEKVSNKTEKPDKK